MTIAGPLKVTLHVSTTGTDSVNNVEMVVAPARRGYWTARVTGTAVPIGPQEFTLIVPNQLPIEFRPPFPPIVPRPPFPPFPPLSGVLSGGAPK